MTNICLIDPAIYDRDGSASPNLGDLIISEAVRRELCLLFPHATMQRISSHKPLSSYERKQVLQADLCVVGGTNLLSSNMDKYRQWKLTIRDIRIGLRPILLGVGWWQYQGEPNLRTRLFLRLVLRNSIPHSVRDEYTKNMLASIRITSAINTGCPTMWPLAQLDLELIPHQKSDTVLTMLTDYKKDPVADSQLIGMLTQKYDNIVFWPQGSGDADYFHSLGFTARTLDRSLEALDQFISIGLPFDYIGTRLHGGIKCLLAGKRSLILEVDNRAAEIARDTNLTTMPRGEFDRIEDWIDHGNVKPVRIHSSAIDTWRDAIRMHATSTNRGLRESMFLDRQR